VPDCGECKRLADGDCDNEPDLFLLKQFFILSIGEVSKPEWMVVCCDGLRLFFSRLHVKQQ
jgi:hypothetical protein